MLRDFLVIFGIACDERSAIEICRGVPSIWGLSVCLLLAKTLSVTLRVPPLPK